MKMLATQPYSTWARAIFGLVFLGLAGCSVLQPVAQPVQYDFGPGPTAEAAQDRRAPLPPLVVAAVQSASAQDRTAVLYRLAYSDAQQLRPYAQTRWSMPPAELLDQRLRERLGQRRAVLHPTQGVSVAGPVWTLRVDLEEFSHLFETAQRSAGLVRLRATLAQAERGAGPEKLVAQRSFVVQRPSTSLDAAGGVRALTAAADAALQELDQWLEQAMPPAPPQ